MKAKQLETEQRKTMHDRQFKSEAYSTQVVYSLEHGLPQPDGVGDGQHASASTNANGHPRLLIGGPVQLTLTVVARVHALASSTERENDVSQRMPDERVKMQLEA